MTVPLPPGQQRTARWPVVGEREPEPFDEAVWRLEVTGAVARPQSLDLGRFHALPRTQRTGTLHCVTRWSRPESNFAGVLLDELLALAGPLPDARFVRFASGRGHDTTLPLRDCAGEVLLADTFEGAPLDPGHGGPVRSVVFHRYLYKSVKWLRRVELLVEDRPGFWERTAGYHNDADPWKEQRYSLPDLDRREVERLFRERDFSRRALGGVELERRDLREFSFRESTLRDARLAGADLRGADFTSANLTNADLRGADLREAVFVATDLDGADLRSADLRGTVVAAFSMACTSFCGPGGAQAARVEGADFRGAAVDGLLEEQRAFLRGAGVPGA